MKMSEQVGGGKYLRAADLQGKAVEVTIDDVRLEQLREGESEKPVLYFDAKESGLVLNKTNGRALIELFGDETDEWHGKAIKLIVMKVNYQGQMVDGIRVVAATSGDDVPF